MGLWFYSFFLFFGLVRNLTEQQGQVLRTVRRASRLVSGDKTECQIRESYACSESGLSHQDHLRESQGIIFKEFGILDPVVIYGDPA